MAPASGAPATRDVALYQRIPDCAVPHAARTQSAERLFNSGRDRAQDEITSGCPAGEIPTGPQLVIVPVGQAEPPLMPMCASNPARGRLRPGRVAGWPCAG